MVVTLVTEVTWSESELLLESIFNTFLKDINLMSHRAEPRTQPEFSTL